MTQVRARCELVVATAVFEGAWLLRQPKHCGDGAARRLRDAQAQDEIVEEVAS